MALDQGTETVTIKTTERTWRINIESALDSDPVFTVHREQVKADSNDQVISKTSNIVATRNLSDVADQSYTAGGKTFTTQEIANAIAAMADTWRTEDLAKPPPGAAGFVAPTAGSAAGTSR